MVLPVMENYYSSQLKFKHTKRSKLFRDIHSYSIVLNQLEGRRLNNVLENKIQSERSKRKTHHQGQCLNLQK